MNKGYDQSLSEWLEWLSKWLVGKASGLSCKFWSLSIQFNQWKFSVGVIWKYVGVISGVAMEGLARDFWIRN